MIESEIVTQNIEFQISSKFYCLCSSRFIFMSFKYLNRFNLLFQARDRLSVRNALSAFTRNQI
jgi:hypothetical protein